jgi:hypothetical protein
MRKNLADFSGLSRLAVASHMRTAASQAHANNIQLRAYTPWNIAKWVTSVGRYWFSKKHAFLSISSYENFMSNSALISVAADWGTGTDEAKRVADTIKFSIPDYTIHLGDVYYVGDEKEIKENFMGIKVSDFDPVEWPKGSKGTLAIPGNHEMYANGSGFYDTLLPWINQPVSYFQLTNDYWMILGLDTAYNSTGLGASCEMPDQLMHWLDGLHLSTEKRRIVVLTHHNPLSAFDTSYPKIAAQLSGLIKQPWPLLWLWGHEHRMAIYEPWNVAGLNILGSCIGHGGMPFELKKPRNGMPHVQFTDTRKYPNDEGLDVGYNGFAEFAFENESLEIRYKDLYGTVVHREMFQAK